MRVPAEVEISASAEAQVCQVSEVEMHVFSILLALIFLVGLAGCGLRWYYSEPQIKRREERRKVLGPYRRWDW